MRAGSGDLPWARQNFDWRQHDVNLSDTWVIRSNRINQAWFSFNRNFGRRLNLPAVSLTDLGSAAVIQGAPSLPQITVSGFFTLTKAIGGPTAGGDSGQVPRSRATGSNTGPEQQFHDVIAALNKKMRNGPAGVKPKAGHAEWG